MNDVRKSLGNLQSQIERTQLEGEKRKSLEEIRELIHLINSQPNVGHHYSLKGRLKEAMVHFDAEHHELVVAMQSKINALSTSGL